MKKTLLLVCSAFVVFSSCLKNNDKDTDASVKSFDNGGVHFIVKNGTPFDTKAQSDNYTTYTIEGEKNGTVITLYTVDKVTAPGFITSETFFDDGTLLSTAILYNERVVSYEVSSSLLNAQEDYYSETKSIKGWWQSYKKCVLEGAEEMSANLLDNPIDRATCEWIPCETIIVAINAFRCLTE